MILIPNSEYFRITEFKDTFTGGKNGFLIEGSPLLKETTEVKIEILDVEGNPIYFEPGDGIPEYYEGLSKLYLFTFMMILLLVLVKLQFLVN
jgi:hypothetical protein